MASWSHSSPWGQRPAWRQYGRWLWRTKVKAPCVMFTSRSRRSEDGARRGNGTAAGYVIPGDVFLCGSGSDDAVAADTNAGGDARPLPYDGDAAVEDLGLLLIGAVVLTPADVAVGADEGHLVQDGAFHEGAGGDGAVVEEGGVHDRRPLLHEHPRRDHRVLTAAVDDATAGQDAAAGAGVGARLRRRGRGGLAG